MDKVYLSYVERFFIFPRFAFQFGKNMKLEKLINFCGNVKE